MLSDKQIAAAHRLGQDVCVVAGPGSGKTSVLIERFSWLVTERGISPNRILAITFTDKAATEIKQRMTKRFEHDAAVGEQIERAYVSTIHAFCARLLRENAIAAGVDPQFEVLDWAPADRLLREVADEVLEQIYTASPERMRHFLRSLAVATTESIYEPDLAKSLMAMYAAIRVAGVAISSEELNRPHDSGDLLRFRELLTRILSDRPRTNTGNQRAEHEKLDSWAREFLSLPPSATTDHFRLLNEKFNKGALVKNSFSRNQFDEFRNLVESIHSHFLMDYYAQDRELVLESLRDIDRVYRARKRAISALDFDDLEEFAIQLLESNEQLRVRVATQFDFILMDELQDTNPLQWRLLKLIRRSNNFFAVGDVNQSIFGFRHAEPELFLNYRGALEASGQPVDQLRDNYRTIPELIEVVNQVFNCAPGIEPHTLTAMRSDSTTGKSVQVISAQGETAEPTERLEAQAVAGRIAELVAGGQAAYRDIAILTRANIATAALQNALDDAGVPSIVLGGLTLFETREIRDIVLLLSVIVNPRNEIALAGVLRSPLFGISDEELFRMTLDRTLAEAVEQEPPPGWELIAEVRAIRNSISPDRLLRRVLDAVDYESGLSSRARANIEKFLAGLRNRHEGSPAPLATILREIESAAPDSEAPPADFGDAVRLMTIHKSKGLEFPVVFLPFLHSTRGTSFPVVSYSHEHGLGIKWRDPATRRGAPDTIHAANQTQCEARQSAEDNRVLYVGMTRAKDRLVLSFSDTKFSRGKWVELIKSKLPIDSTIDAVTFPRRAAAVRERRPAPVIVRRSTAVGQRDATASVTDISVFAQCPRKYYLGRYIGLRTTPTGSTGAIEIGNQTHDLLAGRPVPNTNSEAQALARVFQASELGKQAASARRKAHEYDFVFALEDVVLRGQIDLWYEHKNDVVIVDYKTDRHADAAPYEVQIQLYTHALTDVTRAYLYFLRANQPVEVNLTPLALAAARETVRDFSRAQESMEFPLKTGPQCLRCEFYRSLCPAGA